MSKVGSIAVAFLLACSHLACIHYGRIHRIETGAAVVVLAAAYIAYVVLLRKD